MPELPEVETVKRGLDKLLVDKIITAVTSDWEKSFPNSKADVDEFLLNAKITSVRPFKRVFFILFHNLIHTKTAYK